MSIAIEITWDEIPTPNEKKLSNIMTSNTPKKSFALSFIVGLYVLRKVTRKLIVLLGIIVFLRNNHFIRNGSI